MRPVAGRHGRSHSDPQWNLMQHARHRRNILVGNSVDTICTLLETWHVVSINIHDTHVFNTTDIACDHHINTQYLFVHVGKWA